MHSMSIERLKRLSMIKKRNDETPLDFHKRIIYGKLIDKTLSDIDYSELAEFAYGQAYSSDVARRMFYGSCRTLQLLDNENIDKYKTNKNIGDDIDNKIIELKKERQKLSDERSAYNKIVRECSRKEELKDALAKSIDTIDLPKLNCCKSNIEPSDNDLLVSLNDVHYGININNAWNEYNPEICKQMFEKYLNRILEIGKQHNSENCIVFNCGDSISGNIHPVIQMANIENLVEQVKNVSELIAQFLLILSENFNEVRYYSVSGNHSRLGTKKDSPYNERLDDLISWYLEARLKYVENIIIESAYQTDTSMFLADIRGKTYCGVHGDFDDSVSKVNALQTMAQKPLYAILSGHLHHNKIDSVNGIKTIMAGSFLGMDDYCVQKRIYGNPEQLVCICNSNGIECSYSIPLKMS